MTSSFFNQRITPAVLKIIHTSDWHLGHQLHGYDRQQEHQAFLDWLQQQLIDEEADALLVAGDIFDSANPPASAWRMLYRFLADVAKALPQLNVIITGGNHDSPSKLDAPHELLKAFDLHLIGAISRHSDGSLDTERMMVPVTDKEGQTAAWVMAVPFLRSSDLRTEGLGEDDDRLIEGVRQIYQQTEQAARAKCTGSQALIAMGHVYMASGQLSEMSERRILGGNQHALPADIFAKDVAYVALGHLHLAQRVAKQERIRYCGSPIPLSLSERHYRHQVLAVTLEGEQLADIRSLEVPRKVDLLRVPDKPAPLDEVIEALQALTLSSLSLDMQPLLEVPVLLDAPQPMLREKILAALEGQPIRLAKITPHYRDRTHERQFREQRLSDVEPFQVFRHGWQQKYQGEPDPAIAATFSHLLEQLEQDEDQ
ncbi:MULTISPECIES: exonuclease SbcCD subunit D C-terminal domain-containing protein [unclassified Salinivibrio]|uniref:exonuclease SbcCD subunit D C-terminal domain-containing protein n=1 Tax=unclassified Salinivibrio TaxID=2636825 RepID=UPI00084C2FB2|nr:MULTISPECIES: exonuclease SbcCD subunit D C-terminal domain-containing protein [unclassified Salinivibrio]ODP96875.1 exonuclease sbcCD subunit D [Salinivibrio sp. DV]PCE67957.1 exonuclease sbcCD subunit D [Salinivibrio sp. YCSC6]QCF35148.1 exonuclease subunit SbcD [Salinivibrio sp. YCSC6]